MLMCGINTHSVRKQHVTRAGVRHRGVSPPQMTSQGQGFLGILRMSGAGCTHPERFRITLLAGGSSVPEASRPRLSSPLARSHTERSRSAGKSAALLAMRVAHSMVRSSDLAPRRRILCGASKAGNSNDDGFSPMIADIALGAASWRRTRRSVTALRPSQSLPHESVSTRSLCACSALNARSNDRMLAFFA